MVTCSSCGKENLDWSEFCFGCGSKLPKVKKPPIQIKKLPASGGSMVRPVAPLPVAIGRCFYHPSLPAAYICARCGRAICRYCAKPYGSLVFCPQCYPHVTPILWVPAYQPASTYQSTPSTFP